jgi:hypothetical protein
MEFTCDKCGHEFDTYILIETGGEYSNQPHKEPASPCCEDTFTQN